MSVVAQARGNESAASNNNTQHQLKELFGNNSANACEEAMTRWRVCVRCEHDYKECDNLGTWKCRMFHPMHGYMMPGDKKFLCCGKPLHANGCVRADHTDAYEWSQDPMPINPQVVELMLAERMNANWIKRGNSDAWLLQRVDPDQYQETLDRSNASVDPAPVKLPIFN